MHAAMFDTAIKLSAGLALTQATNQNIMYLLTKLTDLTNYAHTTM